MNPIDRPSPLDPLRNFRAHDSTSESSHRNRGFCVVAGDNETALNLAANRCVSVDDHVTKAGMSARMLRHVHVQHRSCLPTRMG
jgi:hypothetical protein